MSVSCRLQWRQLRYDFVHMSVAMTMDITIATLLFLSCSECLDCLNGGTCNPSTKMCDCEAAFDGPDCRKLACAPSTRAMHLFS